MATELTSAVVEVLTVGLDPRVQIAPEDAACDALAAHFAGVTGIADARRGWPEHPQDLDLRAGPVVTATLIESRRTPVSPTILYAGLQRVAEMAIDVQLDLWCAYRAERDTTARAVESAFHNGLPWRSGLRLVSLGYHDRQLVVTAASGRNTDEPDAATAGEWRRTWLLTVQTDVVIDLGALGISIPTQDVITLRPTVQDVVEADITIT